MNDCAYSSGTPAELFGSEDDSDVGSEIESGIHRADNSAEE